MSAGDINTITGLWVASLAPHHDSPPFANAKALYDTIDSMPIGDIPWQNFTLNYHSPSPEALGPNNEIPPWTTANYDIWFCNAHLLVQEMIANHDFVGEFDFVPYQEYSADGQHHFENFMSGDWAWKQAVSYSWNLQIHLLIEGSQDKIIITHPKNKGAFFVPVILGSDKTTVSITTGQTEYWPVYISIGNICNNVQHTHHNGVMLLGFLACPKCEFLFIFCIACTYLNTIYR